MEERNMPKNELIKLTDTYNSIRQIAKATGKSYTTVRYWLKKHGLKSKGKFCHVYPDNNKCELCQKKNTQRFCGSCRTKIRRYRNKMAAINLLGGKCKRCGWSGNQAALEFHHKLPDKKEFTIGMVANKSWNSIEQEIKKCEMVRTI